VNTLWIVFFGEIAGDLLLTISGFNSLLSVTVNYIFSLIVALTFYLNGYIRILATSRRLSPLQRVLGALFIVIPPIQLGFSYYLSREAMAEYDHECYKSHLDEIRVESKICQTKYPLVMLHGVGFRDLKYFNYWGRVPRELIKHGSRVYYGHQEAWGTIEDNAEEVKLKILEVIEAEGCEKVNIIAHSKGGLDARYVVSQLGMGDYVASLTMISTPHRGSEVLEFVEKLPNKLVKLIGNGINRHFKIMGDKAPNFHVASKQFLIEYSKEFNERVKDDPRVYYQSYATSMKTPFSDLLLFIPYCIVKIMGTKNDGLVTIDSAKWGEFQGVITNQYHRGISHGDIIDLKREDYQGFDVREFYIQLVQGLKAKGF
jgi:triacylglycerol lipase